MHLQYFFFELLEEYSNCSPGRVMDSGLPNQLSAPLVERLVYDFYDRVRADTVLGPIFETRLSGRWDAHLCRMVDFWSSIALKSGRYAGSPHVSHQHLGLTHEHFMRWLMLFEGTVMTLCTGHAADFFVDRAHRIADSLQLGLDIGPKRLRFPIAPTVSA